MGIVDSTKNTALSVSGRGKEIAGFVFKNRDLQTEGKADQITANLRRARDKGAEAVQSVRKASGL
ncbi:MAG: CsbD family protein [Actinobacteria bacterium]|nr:CsbD family protein [Actinomycetota bacterium]